MHYILHIFTIYILLIFVSSNICDDSPTDPGDPPDENPQPGELQVETLAKGLDTPWDLAWGPDNAIWVTERNGTISRVDTASGIITQVGQINIIERSESGLMGMAFHPDFQSQPYVYAAHSYSSNGNIVNRLVRLQYDGSMLGSPEILLDNIPGASNHDGSRLTIGPDRFLYMTTGDALDTDLPQQTNSLAGKVLRLNLDGTPAPGNPFNNQVYSIGHRNPQGIVFHPETGSLFITEHGPSDNDEVNQIELGRNYGWPNVRGFCDGDVQGEVAFCQANNVAEPVAAWTPTIAPSGCDFYNSNLIPNWKGSFLFTTLKGSALYRLTFSSDGNSAASQHILFQNQFGRLRDVLVGPDGKIYLATSNRDGRGSPTADDDRILRISP